MSRPHYYVTAPAIMLTTTTVESRQHETTSVMTDRSSPRGTRQRASHTSGSSSRSSLAAAAARARAKAEAAKARLALTLQNNKMKEEQRALQASMDALLRQQAILRDSLDALAEKRETAAAVAEAEALEAAFDQNSDRHSCSLDLDRTPLDPTERTKNYIKDQATQQKGQDSNPQRFSINGTERPAEIEPVRGPQTPPPRTEEPIPIVDVTSAIGRHHTPSLGSAGGHLHKARPETYHRPIEEQHNNHQWQGNEVTRMADFMRYFARRELVTTSLFHFDDQPDSYRAWKHSFLNTTKGLNLTCSEEMGLLVKWLGKESAKHASRLRNAHPNRPEKGLQMMWDRLDTCYGSPELVERALLERVDRFPKLANRDHAKLTELSDLLVEVLSVKEEGNLPGLAYLDTARGIGPIAQKLPFSLHEKWLSFGSDYKERLHVPFPPFEVFVDFVSRQARIRNDPSFGLLSHSDVPYRTERVPEKPNRQRVISVNKTELSSTNFNDPTQHQRLPKDPGRQCPLHKKPHPLAECRALREMPLEKRQAYLKQSSICFRCCASTGHMARSCKLTLQCAECGSDKHQTALHPGPAPWNKAIDPDPGHGGEEDPLPATDVTTQCTQVCGGNLTGRSCAKICLAKVYPVGQREKALRVYVIIDEQSNRSLARSEFFDIFGGNSPSSAYSLKTCAGVMETTGRRAYGYQVESTDGRVSFPLPSVIECNEIPNDRSEIPTPSAALNFPHLKTVANLIPEIEPRTPILLLLGRDAIRAHKVRRQVDGPNNAPFAQKLDLGWVIVGNVCLGSAHKPSSISAYYTNALEGGRPTTFEPCPNVFQVRERYGVAQTIDHPATRSWDKPTSQEEGQLGCTVFRRTNDDDKLAPSVEDTLFSEIMERELKKDSNNSWVAPLPFRSPRRRLPDNRAQAASRLCSLRRSLNKKPEMREHFLSFMGKIFENGHAEAAPPLKEGEERWYLPTFGVYHPKKPGKIRVVFDSSAKYNGVSLNDVLLTGPDLNNTLLGVLIRFREEPVAITADIEQMFHCFLVREDHWNFLRLV